MIRVRRTLGVFVRVLYKVLVGPYEMHELVEGYHSCLSTLCVSSSTLIISRIILGV